eukprot:15760_1
MCQVLKLIDVSAPYEIFIELGSPKHTMAPMVFESDLAFRMMTRHYNTKLCYSPMITSKSLIKDYEINPNNINKHIITCSKDRPLIVQLCSNDCIEIVKAAKIIENNIKCDAIDINLGCPQSRAKTDNFGAFLLTQPNIVKAMVTALVKQCNLPIFAKIRILPTFDETLKFVKMLIKCGVSLITIHGRQIHQKHYGLADINMIKKIKQSINKIPIISNGNIQKYSDIDKILNITNCDGIMTANAIRKNPYLFKNNIHLNNKHGIDICWEYLEYVQKYGTVKSESINRHILQFCHKYLNFENWTKSKKKKYEIEQINKLLRLPEVCKLMIQFKALLDLMERVVDKKKFKHPNITIFTVQQIKKQREYTAYYHKHAKHSNHENIVYKQDFEIVMSMK